MIVSTSAFNFLCKLIEDGNLNIKSSEKYIKHLEYLISLDDTSESDKEDYLYQIERQKKCLCDIKKEISYLNEIKDCF